MSDYIGSEFIDSYHNDASFEWMGNCDFLERESIQAQENLHSFSAACGKMQIPLSCVATMKDFKERNVRLDGVGNA